jgi:hypothetical protein
MNNEAMETIYTANDFTGANGIYSLRAEHATCTIQTICRGQWIVRMRFTTKQIEGYSYTAYSLKQAKQAAAESINLLPKSHSFKTAAAR